MDITSFTFLGPEDNYYNISSPWFQEVDNGFNKKRKKEDESLGGGGNDNGFFNEEELKKSGYGDILASLLLLEEEAKEEQDQRITESQQDKVLFESNHKRKVEAMNEYYNQLQQDFSEVDHLDSLNIKRARKSASALAATVATTAGDDNVNVGNETSSGSGQQRRLWVKDRSKDWWDRCNHPDFPEEEFRKAFRMSKATFGMICKELEPVVMKKNTMLRDAIPVRQRVAVCIWRLATGEPLRLVSKRFGVGISTCHKLVLEVCSAIKTVLMPKFLQWPDENKMKENKEAFASMSGVPNVGGSMYTTHVPIIAPKVNVAAYFNRRHTERNQKPSYSITVQGVVDQKGIFTDVCIGWPGSMHDDQVLEKSALYQRANKGCLKDVSIVGNSGYPLMDWALVPYTHQNLTWAQHGFNEKIGGIQNVAKEAFTRLKGRWSCLHKRTEVKLQELPIVIGACCVLHNICQMSSEEMEPELQFQLFDDEMIPENNLRSANAVLARDHIAHNLLHHSLGGTGFL
ncbi:protein ALP1-like [Durio zibethinus]|uniref:Protein ALP1-like n=1 Tax=Durio zibethinus TaxID=66656 RepID=A0A6P5YZH3_DURZI|nr:protein ALP1-like [Durio zibethinus]